MDTARIEAAGIKPPQAEMTLIDGIKDRASFIKALAHLHVRGSRPLFSFGSTLDFKDSTRVIAEAVQGGLGMPNRDYYTKDDATSTVLRAAYVKHVAKVFKLAGDTMAAAATKAQIVMEIETTLAKASMTKTQKRDPNPISNRKSAADLGGLTLAYKALEKSLVGKARPKPIDGFTAEQRFFLGYAQAWASNSRPEYTHTLINTDPHPPAQFRVNGPLSNLAVFAKAFGAKPGDPMVRKEAILIW